MAGARKDGQERTAASAAGPFAWPQGADPADPFGMGEWMKNLSNAGLPSVGLHPLMAHPAAALQRRRLSASVCPVTSPA